MSKQLIEKQVKMRKGERRYDLAWRGQKRDDENAEIWQSYSMSLLHCDVLRLFSRLLRVMAHKREVCTFHNFQPHKSPGKKSQDPLNTEMTWVVTATNVILR